MGKIWRTVVLTIFEHNISTDYLFPSKNAAEPSYFLAWYYVILYMLLSSVELSKINSRHFQF